MNMSESRSFSVSYIKFGLCLTGLSLLVGCSSPYKYAQRETGQTQAVYQKPAVQPAPKAPTVAKAQAAQLNYYQSSEIPQSETLSEPEVTKPKVIKPPIKAQSQPAVSEKSAACPDRYKVVSGDRLSSIAFRCRLELKVLAKRNNIRPPYDLQIGQVLSIPKPEQVTAVATTSASSAKAKVTSTKSVTKNEVNSLIGSKWTSPVDGQIPRKYVKDSKGLSVLEYYGVAGQRVNAVSSGKVVYSGNGIINFGWMVVIKHDDDFMSVYAHNSSVLVKEGDRVQKGQFIATMGATGNTSKPKLYLEARFKGKKVDIKKVF